MIAARFPSTGVHSDLNTARLIPEEAKRDVQPAAIERAAAIAERQALVAPQVVMLRIIPNAGRIRRCARNRSQDGFSIGDVDMRRPIHGIMAQFH